jgi:hypothetical protein
LWIRFNSLLEIDEMTFTSKGARRCATIGLAALVLTGIPGARAEPLVIQGIGTSSCDRLGEDINPSEGLGNPINLMVVAWVQGYVSAANIALLEEDSRHIDMNALDDAKVLRLVRDFCQANPDKRPVAAIDDLIRTSAKIKTTWEPGTIEWDQ